MRVMLVTVALMRLNSVAQGMTFMMENFRKADLNEEEQIEELFAKYLHILESGLTIGDKLHLSEFDLFMLKLLVKQMNQITTNYELETPQFWYSRQGRNLDEKPTHISLGYTK